MKQRATEHPILMCAEMVRAIISGKKTETRRMAGLKEINSRLVWPCWKHETDGNGMHFITGWVGLKYSILANVRSPYGVAGDTLWVRETWKYNGFTMDGEPYIQYSADDKVCLADVSDDWVERISDIWATLSLPENFDIDFNARDRKWRPSIHMPRWASRITLTVKDVCLERLHEITDEGAKAECVKDRAEYERLWKEINGEESWNLNPCVWVVKFDVKEVRT